ncbi:MAG: metalloregulator ArsR/SmtB family transcription factor [Lachnospiraceae bacterium]|nr:metalloregulator ArsR/SmtB family transcription factor [Lachnospiraceae bacterium]
MEVLNMPKDEYLTDLADLFKIFGDTTRLRILYALKEREMNVSDLSEVLNMNQSAISHQLKTLRTNKLVATRRDGKAIFYSLADEHIHTIIGSGMEHVLE